LVEHDNGTQLFETLPDFFASLPHELFSLLMADLSLVDIFLFMGCSNSIYKICSSQLVCLNILRNVPTDTLMGRFPNIEAIFLRGIQPLNPNFFLSFKKLKYLAIFDLDTVAEFKFPENLVTLQVIGCNLKGLEWIPPTTESLSLIRTTVCSSLTEGDISIDDDDPHLGGHETSLTSREKELGKRFERLIHL